MPATNTCGNSCKGISKIDQIRKVVEESSIELAPWEVAKKTGLNRATVRDYLRRLLKKGKIVQPYPGTYCSQITHGMIVAPLRTHNVILSVDAPWLQFSDDCEEFVVDVKIRVQFGLQRRRITGRLSCDSGMDKRTVIFALNRCYDIIFEKTGHVVEKVVVKTFEMNRDYLGVRLDGFKCYTKQSLFGVVERLYQKEENLRHEHKVSHNMTVDEYTALLQGGLEGYNTTQGMYFIAQQVKGLTEAQKFTNEQIMKLVKIQGALIDSVNKLKEERGNRE